MRHMVLDETESGMRRHESSMIIYGQIINDKDRTTWLVDIPDENFSEFMRYCKTNNLTVCG